MQQELKGYVERITFRNDETGFSILQVKTPGVKDLICVVATLVTITEGESIHCIGEWKQHLSYGRQFEAKKCEIKAPADLIGIKKYLGSGLVKGIGPVYAAYITDHFGIDTLKIIDEHPGRLKEVKGLGNKRIGLILACWAEQRSVRDVMVFLQGYGITPTYAQKIFKAYGDKAIAVVKENPYQLARDIHGIGFKIADAIAKELGFLKDAQARISAGIEYVLRELGEEGHTCYPEELFLARAETILEVSQALIEHEIIELQKLNRIEKFSLLFGGEKKPFLWYKPFFNAEISIARELDRLKNSTSNLRQIDVQRAVKWVQEKLGIELAEAQCEAVIQSLISKVLIITGGPGTGKSTITKAILKITEQLTDKIILAAPTGRASKRMTEITGKKAQTIHSLLEVNFKEGGFKRNRENPIEADLLVVDEASMIDTQLMSALLKAVPSHCRVIFVGDVNQLPSVGAGNVLQDMIGSLQIPVRMLNEIFRQAQNSQIVVNAHLINKGSLPHVEVKDDSDFYFIEAEEPEDVLGKIVAFVSQRLPRKFGFNSINDIQVLAPMKKGVVGTENLNTILQEQLNPQTDSIFRAGRKFQKGDKVMQIRNNYNKEVYNGDVGRVKEIDLEDSTLLVQFDDREIFYSFSELEELVLAYAVSVHKYQGSECPCVVMPVHTTHFKLLHRNLLYTGVTRGKKLVVLVGTKKALSIAVRNDEIEQRHTGLKQALLGTIK